MDTTRRILLTGASGYLGQHVLYQFLTKDKITQPFHLYALYGSNEGFPEAVQHKFGINPCVTVIYLNITDERAVTTWLDDHPRLDVCIHTAAISSPALCQMQPEQADRVNVPKYFFDKLRAQGCKIIALSTDQIYDGNHAPYIETDTAMPVNVYGVSKLNMENYLNNITGGTAVLLRSSIILGKKAPIAHAHDTFLHFCAGREGTPTDFYTDECRSVVFIDDVVDAIAWFTQNFQHEKYGGIYNLGGPASLSRFDMAYAVFVHLAFDTKWINAKEKKGLPTGAVPSPLDISMDSSKLEKLLNKKFEGIQTIVQSTFPR